MPHPVSGDGTGVKDAFTRSMRGPKPPSLQKHMRKDDHCLAMTAHRIAMQYSFKVWGLLPTGMPQFGATLLDRLDTGFILQRPEPGAWPLLGPFRPVFSLYNGKCS